MYYRNLGAYTARTGLSPLFFALAASKIASKMHLTRHYLEWHKAG